jgi:hypothetical protein
MISAATHEDIITGGGSDDFCLARHLILAGGEEAIGASLAATLERNHGIGRHVASDPTMTRARRRWRRLFYPQLDGRARGIAAHWGVGSEDDRFDTAMLRYGFPAAACSVAWIPPERSQTGGLLISRNFDFTTETLSEWHGDVPAPGEPKLAGQPYVIETYPSDGHATIIVCLFDLASGAVDGMNDAGLVAALLADNESTGTEPTGTPQVGLGEHEVCRYLLESCATAEDAAEALRVAKQYYEFVPCHYVVADRHGRAFVWEHSAAHNREHLIWADQPLVVTNHLLHRHATLGDLPAEAGNSLTYERARRLTAAIAQPGALDAEELKRRHTCVQIEQPDTPVRTLWHAVYDPTTQTVQFDFYLGESANGPRRAEHTTFRLARRPGSQGMMHR